MTDQLANVKKLLEAVALDGFGTRKYCDYSQMTSAQKYLHEHIAPALYVAVKLDDPAYEPFKNPSKATSTAAVKHFVWELARDGQAFYRADVATYTGHLVFNPAGGCFFDDLVAAVCADDPQWVPDHPIINSQQLSLDLKFGV